MVGRDRRHIGKKRDLVVAAFSTTRPIERAASDIVLMSTMKSYFQFALLTRCGIPANTLLGSVADWQAISAMPTAGPTAGNGAFAAYSGKKLGAHLTPYHNTLDVVPHAWQASMLQEIPSLYVPDIPNLAVSMAW